MKTLLETPTSHSMTEMRKRKVSFKELVKNYMEIFGVAIVTALILSYVFKVDLNKPGIISGILFGSVAGFAASNTNRTKKDD